MSSILDVDAVLAGQVAVHSCLLRRLEGHCVVVRADIETVIKEGKVGGCDLSEGKIHVASAM